MTGQVITFGDFRIDQRAGELTRGGAPVAVEPQVLDLIVFLASNPGRVLTRDDIIEAVWDGRIVSDSAIATRINAARAALGDDGTAQAVIRTVPRRGFRFLPDTAQAALPDKPSVAVLPFQNMSGDPEQTYFSDGITNDIITDLSRYAELFVIARHSSFAYRDGSVPAAGIARELGVQYLVEGSVRRAETRIRVTAQLFDPAAGNQLWAERYDRELTDIFEVQDEITEVIVNHLAGRLARLHYRRSLAKSTDAVNAYDHVLRAMEQVVSFDPATVRGAIAEAQAALALDPGFARAHAAIAWGHIFLAINTFCDDIDAEFRLARDAARAAVAADDNEPYAHATLGWVYQWYEKSMERGFAELDRAVALNPGSAHYRSLRAFSMTYAGRSAEALEVLREGMRLNPHYPMAYHLFSGRALFHLQRYDEARQHLDKVRDAQPNHPNALALAAACYAACGRMDQARAAVRQVQQANPRYTIDFARRVLPYVQEAEREQFLEMLAKAGLK